MPALAGNIEDFSIGEIIQVVAMGRKTGTLEIEGAREQISIYFLEGKAVYANPIYEREHLGEILVRRGVVTPGDIDEALARERELKGRGERVRIGSILVSMGALTNEQLSECVTEQIKESIYLIMAEKITVETSEFYGLILHLDDKSYYFDHGTGEMDGTSIDYGPEGSLIEGGG